MAKRRKRRSQKSFDARLVKDLRARRIAFLRELSEMVSNAIGVRVRVVFDGREVVMPKPPAKPKRGSVDRRTAHVAGYGDDAHTPGEVAHGKLPNDDVGF